MGESVVDAGRTSHARGRLRLRLLGPLGLYRDEMPQPVPASRKLRALLAYLALHPRPLSRKALCELLWPGPSDPLGELRWCLSKLRRLLDDDGAPCVVTRASTVVLDLARADVDALRVVQAVDDGLDALPLDRLQALDGLFSGEFLDGVDLDVGPMFDVWLDAQRRRFRGCHAAVLERLAAQSKDAASVNCLERWLRLAPFDLAAHARLLAELARCGRLSEADAHLTAATRRFDAEGFDAAPLQALWRDLKRRAVIPALSLPQQGHGALIVMPFRDPETGDAPGGLAAALAHDVITRLAKLRNLHVIAQGTARALAARGIGFDEVGRVLDVDYVAGGVVRRRGADLSVTVELAEARSARLVWTDVFTATHRDALDLLDAIGDRIVAAIAREIELSECHRAVLKPPSSLDAWESHHCGLWHMYRFTADDNAAARTYFTRAVALDPAFSRAHAGLSFTHFQEAFQRWGDPASAIHLATSAASASLIADERDPAAHWAMGRALWLQGEQQDAVAALERAVDLSPNFALGHYTLAFVNAQTGDPQGAIAAADRARALSPCDPLLFGMLGARSIALLRQGDFPQAAQCAAQAAARPNAHAHIQAIAAYAHALAGDGDGARRFAARTFALRPSYTLDDFLSAFLLAPDAVDVFRRAAARLVRIGA